MTFDIFRHLRSSQSRLDPAVKRDADELMHLWGAAAYGRAIDIAAQEASTSAPGHWLAVRREIGRRIGQDETGSQVASAA